MINIFEENKARQKLKELVNSKIQVEGVTYAFSDMIDNEYVSDFPIYSHRMRNAVVKGTELFDSFVAEADKNLYTMQQEINVFLDEKVKYYKKSYDEYGAFIQTKVAEYMVEKTNDYNTFETNKQNQINEYIKNKSNELNALSTDVNSFFRGKIDELNNFINQETNKYLKFENSKQGEITSYIDQKTQAYNTFETSKQKQINNYINEKTRIMDNNLSNLQDRINKFDTLEGFNLVGNWKSLQDEILMKAFKTLSNIDEILREIKKDSSKKNYFFKTNLKNTLITTSEANRVELLKLYAEDLKKLEQEYNKAEPLTGKFLITRVEDGNLQLEATDENTWLNDRVRQPYNNSYNITIAGKQYTLNKAKVGNFQELPLIWTKIGNAQNKKFWYVDLTK